MLGTFGAYKYKPAAFIVLAKSLGGKQGCSCADERLYVVSPLFLYLTVTFLCHVEYRAQNFCVFMCKGQLEFVWTKSFFRYLSITSLFIDR